MRPCVLLMHPGVRRVQARRPREPWPNDLPYCDVPHRHLQRAPSFPAGKDTAVQSSRPRSPTTRDGERPFPLPSKCATRCHLSPAPLSADSAKHKTRRPLPAQLDAANLSLATGCFPWVAPPQAMGSVYLWVLNISQGALRVSGCSMCHRMLYVSQGDVVLYVSQDALCVTGCSMCHRMLYVSQGDVVLYVSQDALCVTGCFICHRVMWCSICHRMLYVSQDALCVTGCSMCHRVMWCSARKHLSHPMHPAGYTRMCEEQVLG